MILVSMFSKFRSEVISGMTFAIGLMATFFGQVILSRVSSPQDFGQFIVIYSAATFFSAVGASGLDLSAVRFISIFRNDKNYTALRNFMGFATRTTCLMSIGAVILFTFFVTGTEDVGYENALLSIVVVYFWSCARSLAGVLRGLGALPLAIAIDRVARDLAVFILALVALVSADELTVFETLLALLGGTATGVFVGLYDAKSRLGGLPTSGLFAGRDREEEREWGRASRGLMRYNLVELLSSRLDIFILAFLIPTEQVGAVAIAIILLNIVGIPSIFLSIVLLPKMAVMGRNGSRAELARQFKWVTAIAVGSGLVIATLLVFGQPLILRLMAPSMAGMLDWDTVFVAIFVRAISLVGTFPAVVLTMTGRHNGLLIAQFSSMALRCIIYGGLLSYPSPDLGVIAFVSGLVAVAAISLFQVRRQIWGVHEQS